jgi:hypothetical protein
MRELGSATASTLISHHKTATGDQPVSVSSALSGYPKCMTWDEFAAWRWAYADKLAPGQTVSVGDNYPAEVVGVTTASAEDVLLMLRVPADAIFKWPA